MAKIYLFRHGQSEFNLNKIFTGWLDAKLTETGVQNAKEIAEKLKDKEINIAYTTRLSRAKDTLSEVLKMHPECRETVIDDRIIERSYGSLAGLKHEDVINKYGQEQFSKWHRGWSDRPPEGESFADVEIRVAAFINDLKNKYGNKEIGIAISAHGNSIRLFRKIMENSSIEEASNWNIPYNEYFEYEI